MVMLLSSEACFVLAFASLIWGVVSAVLITAALHQHGVRINYLFMRVLLFRYVHQYRAITLKETGRVGPLFYSFVIAMNLALLAAVTGVVVRVGFGF